MYTQVKKKHCYIMSEALAILVTVGLFAAVYFTLLDLFK